ncbi:hypothetical protein [Nocardia salmonicida]|uniref:hypothetical protein n=1 Tax=Nocardia salmonicida TaxID=53431 RepID=UPI0036259FB0
MDSTNSTPAAQPPTADLARSLSIQTQKLITEAGFTVPEFEQIAGIPRGRLAAGLVNPGSMAVTDVILTIRAADIDCEDFWQQVEDGAREIAAEVE